MWVDLGLNQCQLHTAQAILLLAVQSHLLVQARDHLLHAFSQRPKFTVLRLNRRPDRQISLSDLYDAAVQIINGLCDTSSNLEAPPQGDGNHYQHYSCRENQTCRKPGVLRVPQHSKLTGLMIQISIHVLFNQLGYHINVVLQLVNTQVVAICGFDIGNTILQVAAQVQYAAGSPATVPVSSVSQQLCG